MKSRKIYLQMAESTQTQMAEEFLVLKEYNPYLFLSALEKVFSTKRLLLKMGYSEI